LAIGDCHLARSRGEGSPVFLVSRDLPHVSPRIPHCRAAVAIGRVYRLLDRRGTGLNRSLICSVSVFHINVEKGRHGLALAAAITDHNDRVADFNLRRHANALFAASIENGLEKSNHAGDVISEDSRRYSARASRLA
jgi:hypothetical protein